MRAQPPGQVPFPAWRFDTEVPHIAVSGSASGGDRELKDNSDLRLIDRGSQAGAVVAGPEGFRETIVFGDRRSVTPARIQASELPNEWEAFLQTSLAQLRLRLGLREAAPAA